jgi:hypothetical protein
VAQPQRRLPWLSEKASASFLKKRSKKLLFTVGFGPVRAGARVPGPKVFWFFFSKKNILPALYRLPKNIALTDENEETKP